MPTESHEPSVDPIDVELIVMLATNEGDLYPKWVRMARATNAYTNSAWAVVLRPYLRRCVRAGRYQGSMSPATIDRAAAAVRDYYLQQVTEL